jgi:hypothetical protein
VDFLATAALGSPQSVEVKLTVAAQGPSLSTFSSGNLFFIAQQLTNPAPQTVTLTYLSSQELTVSTAVEESDAVSWLKVTSSSSVLTSFQPIEQPVSVSTGLSPGVYTGVIHETVSGMKKYKTYSAKQKSSNLRSRHFVSALRTSIFSTYHFPQIREKMLRCRSS